MSVVLLWLSGIEYAVLVGAYTWRLAAFRAAVLADLSDPARAFGYFTFVAATEVLGARLAVDGHHIAALVLLAVGWVAWLALGYVVPWAAVLGHCTPTGAAVRQRHVVHLGGRQPVDRGAGRHPRA